MTRETDGGSKIGRNISIQVRLISRLAPRGHGLLNCEGRNWEIDTCQARPTPSEPAIASPEAPTPVFYSSTKPETLFSDVDDTAWYPESSNPGSRVPGGAAATNTIQALAKAFKQTRIHTGEIDCFVEIMASLCGSIPLQSPGLGMFQLPTGAQSTGPD
jgi:hypothetical protein